MVPIVAVVFAAARYPSSDALRACLATQGFARARASTEWWMTAP